MQHGTYESSCRAATGRREGDGTYNPHYARYLLFCSFGDASPRRSSSAFFKPRGQRTTYRDWRPCCIPLFFFPSPLLTFLLPRDPLPFCARTLRDGLANPTTTGFRQSHSMGFQEIRFFERNLSCYDAKLKYCFTRECSPILDPYSNVMHRHIEKASSWYWFGRLIFKACENTCKHRVFTFVLFQSFDIFHTKFVLAF